MLKNKMMFLFAIGLYTFTIQSMDGSGPMDDNFGLDALFASSSSSAATCIQLDAGVSRDEHRYKQYPEYQEHYNGRMDNALAVAAMQSPQKENALKRKFQGISDKNQAKLTEVAMHLDGGTPSRDKIIPAMASIEPTPQKTFAAAAGLVVESMTHHINTASPSKRSTFEKIRDQAAAKAPTPLLRKHAPINRSHIQDGQLIVARSGDRIFHGGHNVERAFNAGFLQSGQYVMTDRSNRNIGALVDGDCPKTLGYGFDDDMVSHSVEKAVTVGKNPSKKDFRLSQVLGKDLVGSYQKGFAFETVFPVLWINGNDLTGGTDHAVARFSQLDQRGRLEKTTDPRDFVKLSLAQFNNMTQSASSTKLKTGDENVLIANITDEMQNHCTEQLRRLGFVKFPSTIYGIKDDRP